MNGDRRPTPAGAPGQDVASGEPDVLEGVADSWEDTEERLATRKAAAKAVLQHALDTGNAVGKSSEIVEDVRRRYPVEDQKPETYWRKNIRPVLKETDEYSQSKHGYIVKQLGGEN